MGQLKEERMQDTQASSLQRPKPLSKMTKVALMTGIDRPDVESRSAARTEKEGLAGGASLWSMPLFYPKDKIKTPPGTTEIMTCLPVSLSLMSTEPGGRSRLPNRSGPEPWLSPGSF
jgi:hypothetical protein